MTHRFALRAALLLAGAVTAALLLAGCETTREARKVSVYQREGFENTETYSRLFDADVADTCEAARRTLLSQGYQISSAKPDFVSGMKNFQPDGEVHMQISFNVVCLPEGRSKVATAFVNAIQDRYALKKSSNSASVGVGALGSLSIPLSSTDDSMVKVASETIPAGVFYDRFFALMQHYLSDLADEHGSARPDDKAADADAPAPALTASAPR